LHNPAVERVAETPETCRFRLRSLRECRLIIVISPYAARLLIEAGADDAFESVAFLAPGAGTGRLLERAGLRVHWPESGGTSEDLLCSPWLEEIAGASVGIVGAPGGRRLLDQELSRRGARVERVDLYRRVNLAPSRAFLDALASGQPMVIMVSSTGAFDALGASLPARYRARWLEAGFVVSSERLAAHCRRAGVGDIVRADGASDAAMLAALERRPAP